MNDVAWCRAALVALEDRLVALTQFANDFGRGLEEARVAWNDTAAREAFVRYLEPHARDLAAELGLLRQQLTLLREVVAVMEAADEPAAEIHRLSEEAVRLRQRADNEVRTAHRHVDVALDDASTARHLADQAQSVLASI